MGIYRLNPPYKNKKDEIKSKYLITRPVKLESMFG